MTTLKEVAQAAQVSKAAVSYAFSSNPEKRAKLSEVTRNRILEIAEQLHYTPNIIGRGFSLRKSFSVALLLPSHCAYNISSHNLGMFHGVSIEVTNSDYNLLVFFGCQDKFLADLERRRFDGVLLVSKLEKAPAIDRLCAAGMPLVLLGRAFPPSAGVGSVASDIPAWLDTQLHELRRKKCRRIALFCRPNNGFALDNEIIAAFRKRSQEWNIDGQIFDIQGFTPSAVDDYDGLIVRGSSPAIDDFLNTDTRPAAVLSNNLKSNRANLSVWHYDSTQIGRQGAQLLFELIEHPSHTRSIRVPCRNLRTMVPEESNYTLDF